MKSNRKPPPLNFETQLKTIPYRNERVRITQPEDGTGALVVEAELAYHGMTKLLAGLLKAKTSKKYRLEGLARECYERIDGHRTVEQFVDEFMAEHKLTFFEARALIAQYLKSLMERGLIIIAAPDGQLPAINERENETR
jgi:hypothetical protein